MRRPRVRLPRLGRRPVLDLVGGGAVLRHRPGHADVFERLPGRARRRWTPTSLNAPLSRNAPVLMAAAQIFNRNGLGRGARAVVPYARRLTLLPAFLQQLEMESNGKRAAHGRPAR